MVAYYIYLEFSNKNTKLQDQFNITKSNNNKKKNQEYS